MQRVDIRYSADRVQIDRSLDFTEKQTYDRRQRDCDRKAGRQQCWNSKMETWALGRGRPLTANSLPAYYATQTWTAAEERDWLAFSAERRPTWGPSGAWNSHGHHQLSRYLDLDRGRRCPSQLALCHRSASTSRRRKLRDHTLPPEVAGRRRSTAEWRRRRCASLARSNADLQQRRRQRQRSGGRFQAETVASSNCMPVSSVACRTRPGAPSRTRRRTATRTALVWSQTDHQGLPSTRVPRGHGVLQRHGGCSLTDACM